MPTRINKYLSEIGHCSRRGADKLLEQGRITINGKVPELGEKVEEGDVVAVDGNVVGNRTEKHVYIALNKPRGIVCTTDQRVEKDNIVDFVGHPQPARNRPDKIGPRPPRGIGPYHRSRRGDGRHHHPYGP